MKNNDKRLVIFTEKKSNDSENARFGENWTVENYWSIGGTGSDYECKTRWSSIPLNTTETGWDRLFVMNHFRNTPVESSAMHDNSLKNLNDRWDNYCKPAAGRLPNYVAVDFYEAGAVGAFVDALNERW